MNLQAATPLLILAVATGLLLLIIAIRRAYLLAAGATTLALLAALLSLPYAAAATAPAFPGVFTFNAQSLGFIGLILASALLVLLIAIPYWPAATPVPREEFSLLLLIGTLGAVALAASTSFAALFLGLETLTLTMIGLVAYPRYRPQAEEAALKYLILSGMSSGFLLFGIGLIELACNSLNFAEILRFTAPDAPTQAMLLAGLAMIAVATGFKLSVVPFHIWVPDIYGGAPAPSAAYVAVIPKLAVLAVLIRLLPTAPLSHGLITAITVVAMLSMLGGNLLALRQGNIKRLLGYSSIAHLGYLLVAILAAGAIGRIAVMFYLVTYALTMIGAFGVIAALSSGAEASDLDKTTDLRGLFWTRPAAATVMTVVMLSLAGIPPAIGFIAKMYIFAAGVHTALWNLTSVMAASTVIGLFYYLNVILMMSMKPGEAAPRTLRLPMLSRLAMAAIFLPVLGFGIAPQPLIAALKAVFG